MRVRTRGLPLHLVILCSLLITLLSGVVAPRPGIPPAAQAANGTGGTTPLVYESFANSSPDNAGWVLGGTNGTASLTGGSSDPNGAGWLRLTSVGQTKIVGYAYYNVPFTLTNGLIVSFDYACWGGVNGPFRTGADGASFYLYDGSTSYAPGGNGGNLGYIGLAGAYVGVRLDEFGGFTGDYTHQRIAIRSRAPSYTLLPSTTVSPSLCDPGAGSRPSQMGAGYQHYSIAITSDLHVTVAAYVPGTPHVYIDRYDLQAAQGTPPATLKFGFAAAAGDATDNHEIRNVTVSGIGPTNAEIMCGCNQSENLLTGIRHYTTNPVALPTGDFFHSFTDFSIPGRGLPLQFTRTYNSLQAGQSGPLGYGWSGDRTPFQTTDATGAITVSQEDGSTLPFSQTAPGTYQAPSRRWPQGWPTAAR